MDKCYLCKTNAAWCELRLTWFDEGDKGRLPSWSECYSAYVCSECGKLLHGHATIADAIATLAAAQKMAPFSPQVEDAK